MYKYSLRHLVLIVILSEIQRSENRLVVLVISYNSDFILSIILGFMFLALGGEHWALVSEYR